MRELSEMGNAKIIDSARYQVMALLREDQPAKAYAELDSMIDRELIGAIKFSKINVSPDIREKAEKGRFSLGKKEQQCLKEIDPAVYTPELLKNITEFKNTRNRFIHKELEPPTLKELNHWRELRDAGYPEDERIGDLLTDLPPKDATVRSILSTRKEGRELFKLLDESLELPERLLDWLYGLPKDPSFRKELTDGEIDVLGPIWLEEREGKIRLGLAAGLEIFAKLRRGSGTPAGLVHSLFPRERPRPRPKTRKRTHHSERRRAPE
jgi:hypothetical protein